jgi:hypothetical protein
MGAGIGGALVISDIRTRSTPGNQWALMVMS